MQVSRGVTAEDGLDVCEQRDTKGLYKKAWAGEIKDFTGVSAPYEEPLNPEFTVDTTRETVEESTGRIIALLRQKSIIE